MLTDYKVDPCGLTVSTHNRERIWLTVQHATESKRKTIHSANNTEILILFLDLYKLETIKENTVTWSINISKQFLSTAL